MTYFRPFCKQMALLIVDKAGASAFDSIQKEALEFPNWASSSGVFMRGSWVEKTFVKSLDSEKNGEKWGG